MKSQIITFAVPSNLKQETSTEFLNTRLNTSHLKHLVEFERVVLEDNKLFVTFKSKSRNWIDNVGNLLKLLKSVYKEEQIYLYKVDTKRDRKIDLSEAQFNKVAKERLTYEQAYSFINSCTVEGESLAFHRTSSVLAGLPLYAVVIDE